MRAECRLPPPVGSRRARGSLRRTRGLRRVRHRQSPPTRRTRPARPGRQAEAGLQVAAHHCGVEDQRPRPGSPGRWREKISTRVARASSVDVLVYTRPLPGPCGGVGRTIPWLAIDHQPSHCQPEGDHRCDRERPPRQGVGQQPHHGVDRGHGTGVLAAASADFSPGPCSQKPFASTTLSQQPRGHLWWRTPRLGWRWLRRAGPWRGETKQC